ncbi:MAG: GCN5-related N-acetyltransferase [Acidobacteriaceae bacterium]|nr:GCN5-related N-acetyltransferase [Acidobacteriaceae bacterium]
MIRAAGVGDLAGVLALERSAAEAPHWAEGEYRAALEGGGVRRCLLVAEIDKRLVGFAVGKVVSLGDEVVGELESVAVAREARRQGAGRALCEAVLEWCRGMGAGEVELEVRVGSAGAVRLYEGLGFVATGRRRGYYREPVEDALLMRLELRG